MLTTTRTQPLPRTRTIGRLLIGGVLVAAGLAHFSDARRGYRKIVPPWTERFGLNADQVVAASGVAEVTIGAGLLALPARRRFFGACAVLLLAAVTPANVYQWRRRISVPGLRTDAARLIRVIGQAPLIAWVAWTTR